MKYVTSYFILYISNLNTLHTYFGQFNTCECGGNAKIVPLSKTKMSSRTYNSPGGVTLLVTLLDSSHWVLCLSLTDAINTMPSCQNGRLIYAEVWCMDADIWQPSRHSKSALVVGCRVGLAINPGWTIVTCQNMRKLICKRTRDWLSLITR